MRKTCRILLVGLLLAILATISWFVLRPHDPEPIYKGKPLTYWLEGLALGSTPTAQANEAVQQIGANAIPTLLRMLKARDSKFKLNLIQFALKHHVIPMNYISYIRFRTAEIRHFEAIAGFTCLGSKAKSAVPALIEIYNQRRSDPFASPTFICQIFAAMGSSAADAVPQLSQDTTNTMLSIRVIAVWALGEIHAQPGLAVPALTRALRDRDEYVRGNSAHSLGAFGPAAQSAAPELVNALADPSLYVRDEAAHALQKIDPAAAANANTIANSFKPEKF